MTRKNGAKSHSDACCVGLLGVRNVNSAVAFMGFSHPSLLHFSRRVRCGWGLSRQVILEFMRAYPKEFSGVAEDEGLFTGLTGVGKRK